LHASTIDGILRRDQFDLATEAARRVIAAELVLRGSSLKVLSRADVVASIAAQDVYPSHKRLGRPGLEPGTNPEKNYFKYFGAALPVELPTRVGLHLRYGNHDRIGRLAQ